MHETTLRLAPRDWLIAGLVLFACAALLPRFAERAEAARFDAADYRLPYSLGTDYWFFAQACRAACDREAVIVLGDSVVWGHYVARDRTLSHYLTALSGTARFENLGVDGIHPAALAGLIDWYGSAIAGKRVLLPWNPLWMSSPRHDLTAKKEFAFNHPRLVPQFAPRIPCYTASIAERLGCVVERHSDFAGWGRHLRAVAFGGTDVGSWSVDHPYGNPFAAIGRAPPGPDEPVAPEPDARPWTARGLTKFAAAWVPIEDSFQARSLLGAIATLRARGNRVCVILGPFNEHQLTEASAREYEKLEVAMVARLSSAGVVCVAPPLLPSDLYADASHPLAEGYELLAKRLLADDNFTEFVNAADESPHEPAKDRPAIERLGRIVFASNRSGTWRIGSVKEDGTELRQISSGEEGTADVDPVVSPDGKTILFTSTRGGKPGVWRMALDGTKADRVCDGDQAEWSPDGTSIAFRRNERLFVRELVTGGERAICPPDWPHPSGPSFSPDGKTIAFACRWDAGNGLFTVPAEGGAPVKVYDKQGACEPHWSPDGTVLVYETETHVASIRPDGTKGRLVTYFGGIQRYPRFGPDGKAVVFCQAPSPEGPWELYAIAVAGGTPRRITEGGSDIHPDWR